MSSDHHIHAEDVMENPPKGIKFVLGVPEKGGSRVQSVLFHKDYWSPSKARGWLSKGKLKYGRLDRPNGGLYYRFRQEDPSKFKRHRVMEVPRKNPYGAVLDVRIVPGSKVRGRTSSKFVVVAVEGTVGDWAAYISLYIKNRDIESLIRVAKSSGRKLFSHEAAKVFPLLNPEKYRR